MKKNFKAPFLFASYLYILKNFSLQGSAKICSLNLYTKYFMQFFHFSSGPAFLPPQIHQEIQAACNPKTSSKTPLLLISHRSDEFLSLIQQNILLAKKLLDIPDNFHILFLPTGASYHFYLSALNLLPPLHSAAFILSGYWSKKAYLAAANAGHTYIAASSEPDNFNHIPKKLNLQQNTQYLHITSNNTIYGTQFHQLPDSPVPIVADMSSDIFSKPIDWSNLGMVYACAQKNFGIPSLSLVIIREDMLGKTQKNIPEILDYQAHINSNSVYNTHSVLQVFVANRMLEWTHKQGGVQHFQHLSKQKSALVYQAIDENSLFNGTCINEDRSDMNICFTLPTNELENAFENHAENLGLSGLRGHRHLGGFRAALYNPIPLEAAEKLAEAIRTFKG